MEASEETRGQPEAASPREEGGSDENQIRRNEIDIGSRTIECSADGEWPRVYNFGGPDDFFQSGPNHRDTI